jgi:predicted RNA binding protein YcfA (HicA-like mRNA interferase family)
MGTKDKLKQRFQSKPKDFTYKELSRFLSLFGYFEVQGAGSRVVFKNKDTEHKIKLHKPHPGTILRYYQLDLIEKELKERGLL